MDHIFFDLDGTLSFNGKISERNCAALRAVREMGHEVILNTGRSRGHVPDWVLQAVAFDGLCCGGAYLSYHGQVIYSHKMPVENAKTVLRAAVRHKIAIVVEGEDYSAKFLCAPTRGNLYIPEDGMEDFLASPYIDRVVKFCFLTPTLPADFPTPGFCTIPFSAYTEGAPFGFDTTYKAYPMRYLVEHCGVRHENTVAVGDSMNDEGMLSYAARCALIGHAPRALDRYASYRSTAEEDGVYEILKHLYGITV